MAGRLVLVSTSHRVAVGLLTQAAWRELLSADRILAAPGHPLAEVLGGMDLSVEDVDPGSPGALARRLLELSAQDVVVWLMGDDADPWLGEALAPQLAAAADAGAAPEVEILQGSFDIPGARLLDLVAVMDRLRSPGGCPWDAEQTHASLAPYLLEETYEALEAIDAANSDDLREELGDLLLQVAFHSRVAEEHPDRPWSIDDVAAGIVAKLVRRHPHVFADADATTPDEVEAHWHQLKAEEKGRTSVVDGVPLAQPALSLAAKLLARAARAELPLEVDEPELPDDLTADQLGLILLGVVSAARRQGLDAEGALRQATQELRRQIRQLEGSR